jgi:subfamily B ATP-binding cassette protein MsbA
MRQLTRLLRYVRPFLLQLFPGVALLAGVGFLEAFRLILLKPVLDRVLNPASGSENILLFTIPRIGRPVYLQQFVPSTMHNAWTIVAFALVASTILKGLLDYAGTYLVNHAGFGMITDLS